MKYLLLLLTLLTLDVAYGQAPADLTQSVTRNGETVTMRMKKLNLRSANFELKTQGADGKLVDVTNSVAERSYLGTVDEYPGAVACGIRKDDGVFRGAIYFDRGMTWFTLGSAVSRTRGEGSVEYKSPTRNVEDGQVGVTMRGFDLAIDCDNDYYANRAGSSVAKTLEHIEFSVALLRGIYMRDALLRPQLARVIIRTTKNKDPYDALGGGAYLGALRTEWNDNQTTSKHDLVAGITTGDVGGGLAWVGMVHESYGFSVNDSDADGNFSVYLRHEVGHNWGSGHYEGDTPEGSTIMSGNAYARFSCGELSKILDERDEKIAHLDNLGTFTTIEIPPYAAMDSSTYVYGSSTPHTISVLANDHDANGQTLTIDSYDKRSLYGATITKQGTNLIYSAPGYQLKDDTFKYTVKDSAGKTAVGIVMVKRVANSSLLLHLPMEETAGTNSEDLSSYSRDATLNGTDFTNATGTGKYGNAVDLDGTDDYLSAPSLGITTNTITYTAWIKQPSSATSNANLIGHRSPALTGLGFGANGNELRYQWSGVNGGWDSNLTITADTWTFVALVISPTKATIYKNDGTGFQSSENITNHLAIELTGIDLGRSNSAYYKGIIDDARIYNKSMTQLELESIFRGGAVENPSPVNGANEVISRSLSWAKGINATTYQVYLGTTQANVESATTASAEYKGSTATTSMTVAEIAGNSTYYWRVDSVTPDGTIKGTVWTFSTGITFDTDGDGVPDGLETALGTDVNQASSTPGVFYVGLEAWLKLDDGVSRTATDDSGKLRHGALINGTGWRAGHIGSKSVIFDGTDDYIKLSHGIPGTTNTFTISGWIRRNGDQLDKTGLIVSRNANRASGIYLEGNKLAYFWHGEKNWTSDLTVPDKRWVFVAFSVSNTRAYLYMGEPGGDFKTARNSTFHTATSLSEPFEIGRDSAATNRDFNGKMDEIRLYNRSLSAAELYSLFDSPLAPVSNAFTVAENIPIGTTVGLAYASVTGNPVVKTYSIESGNDAGSFEIDTATGEITTTAVLDYETTTNYTLSIKVANKANAAINTTVDVEITVTDIIFADDSDGDTLNDNWEVDHYGNVTSVTGSSDTDNDGRTSFEEMAYGLDPKVADSHKVLMKQRFIKVSNQTRMEVRYRRARPNANYNLSYTVQTSGTMGVDSWLKSSLGIEIIGEGDYEWVVTIFPMPTGPEFYRVKVSPR